MPPAARALPYGIDALESEQPGSFAPVESPKHPAEAHGPKQECVEGSSPIFRAELQASQGARWREGARAKDGQVG